MSRMETTTPSQHELVIRVDDELRSGEDRDDAGRLKILEDLYRSLENELEGDLDQEGSARF
ncbi:MAG: hypothetical protein ACLGHL_01995 [Actinomycetota bacterium]